MTTGIGGNVVIAPAHRMANLEQSAIRAMTARCDAVGGINLGQGLCQVDPPAELLDHTAAAIREFSHSYSAAQGDAGFLAAVADKLAAVNGIVADPEREIVTTVGATGAFTATLTALFNPGDGIVLFEPFYGYHLSAIRLLELQPQPVPLVGPGFQLDGEALENAVTPRTRAIVVCTPGNPSGRRFTAAELEAVRDVAVRHDLLVITDEIYEHIHYTGEPHLSPAAVPGLGDRTVTISGLSKTFSVPGWRLGYAAAPAPIAGLIKVAADTLSVCAPTPLQQAAVHALRMDSSYYEELRAMYNGKRARLADAFARAGLKPNDPEGAYYLFVDCSALGVGSGWEAADLLLDKYGVATVPGEAFSLTGAGIPRVRACFSVPDSTLDEVAERLSEL